MTHWLVIDWSSRPASAPDGESISLQCKACEEDMDCPTAGDPGSPIIAMFGMSVVFDNPTHKPPKGWLPDVIQCPKCKAEYSADGGAK